MLKTRKNVTKSHKKSTGEFSEFVASGKTWSEFITQRAITFSMGGLLDVMRGAMYFLFFHKTLRKKMYSETIQFCFLQPEEFRSAHHCYKNAYSACCS
jgi:hypothetical protein